MIGIIDYGAGNLLSVKNALDYLGYESAYVRKPSELVNFQKIILPGVGSFGSCMNNIRQQELEDAIKNYIASGRPFLGICIGLQLLFETSEESPEVPGMGIFKGTVKRFTKGKVPQIGWNNIKVRNTELLEDGYVYFVNSYYANPEDEELIVAQANYNGDFVAAIERDNVFATQFHPEKSSDLGLSFFRRWLSC